MANNRMWLRCEHCQDEVLLAKYYPKLTDGWFLPELRHEHSVPAFLEQHSYCPGAFPTMYGNTSFTLRFEVVA
jgi:hypothetical protein